jgi:hypothetical protein
MELADKIQEQEKRIKNLERIGQIPVEQEAFEFVFARMKDPCPAPGCGGWNGYRLRTDRV